MLRGCVVDTPSSSFQYDIAKIHPRNTVLVGVTIKNIHIKKEIHRIILYFCNFNSDNI